LTKKKKPVIKVAEVKGDELPLASIKKKDKVAIVGYAPSSRDLAPYNDKDYDIWGVNELYKISPRVDVLFELHHEKWLRSKERNPDHVKWLKSADIPIVMLDKISYIKNSIRYPAETILSKYPRYFTNSISYMIALAIELGYKEISVFGIDMATTDDTGNAEYMRQRPSVEFFLGYAAGRGINIYIPPQSDLCKTMFLYGYEDEAQTAYILKVKSRKHELQERINNYKAQVDHNWIAMNQMVGALDDLQYMERCWQNDNYNGNEWSPINPVGVDSVHNT
jgi:hypothetical protein